ncbi:TetR/AcrR family transcriptional regulator [Saccharopolyspora mangrovi]|uniref:TetR/AcrR family transcriptional regulator n=1 Tax=Saccharopolyspora mangrovi TaxID=3082379 RepID=A0ABU6AHW2_9PSEU|nr:TetR/AcrR family transcriptional regulator [Saccharopolyspora sp. S2-29]MEB3370964.1 TetR/AcrR family transcriptional regulator [Saccharopolyspora sp. S2-29]
MTESATPRPQRADAERTTRKILTTADQLLGQDPTTTLEQIATAAGVARATLHRRFTSREALIEAMTVSALTHVNEAIEAGRPGTAPPLVALHQVTANVIDVKSGWRFTLNHTHPASDAVSTLQDQITHRCLQLLARAQQAGLLPAETDLSWPQRTYYALLDIAIHEHAEHDTNTDELADRVVTTLLNGVGTRVQQPSQ